MNSQFGIRDYVAHLLLYTAALFGILFTIILWHELLGYQNLLSIRRAANFQERALCRIVAFAVPLFSQTIIYCLFVYLVPFARRIYALLPIVLAEIFALLLIYLYEGHTLTEYYPVVKEGMSAPEGILCFGLILLCALCYLIAARNRVQLSLDRIDGWLQRLFKLGVVDASRN